MPNFRRKGDLTIVVQTALAFQTVGKPGRAFPYIDLSRINRSPAACRVSSFLGKAKRTLCSP